ncbi:MAG: ABC transporter permease subunit [Thermodesulfobacteriota bacterium]
MQGKIIYLLEIAGAKEVSLLILSNIIKTASPGPQHSGDYILGYEGSYKFLLFCACSHWYKSLVSLVLTRTSFGQLMVSIRGNPKRVAYMGLKVPQTKALIYVISGGFNGIASSFLHLFQNVIALIWVLAPDPDLVMLDEPSAKMSKEEIYYAVELIR